MRGFDSKYRDLPDYILQITHQIWEEKDVESINQYYAKGMPTRSPQGVIYGAEPVVKATYATLEEFPDRQLLGEDVIWIGNDDEGYFFFSSYFYSSNACKFRSLWRTYRQKIILPRYS